MNLITVDISNFRSKLSDYLTLVYLGKAVVSIKNAKSGKEIARMVSPATDTPTIETRIRELSKLAGFASGRETSGRKKFDRMETDYTKKLKQGIVE